MQTCDFCGGAMAVGAKEIRAAKGIAVHFPGDYTVVDSGEWIACTSCAVLIDAKAWRSLMQRCKETSPSLRAAAQQGFLAPLVDFVASTWSGIFDVKPEAFL